MDIENVIPWHCKTDVDRVAIGSQDAQGNITRSLQLVAEARYDAFQANLPDLAVLGQVVEPIKVIKDWSKLSCFDSIYIYTYIIYIYKYIHVYLSVYPPDKLTI